MNNLSFAQISADVWVKTPNTWWNKQRQSRVLQVKLLRASMQLIMQVLCAVMYSTLYPSISDEAEVSHKTIEGLIRITAFFASDSRIDLRHLFPDCPGQRWGGKDSERGRWGIMCNSLLMGSMAWEFSKRADSWRMREEADYPPSFCVWDQDQQEILHSMRRVELRRGWPSWSEASKDN